MEAEIHENEAPAQEEKVTQYPAAKVLADACFQDYMRLQDNYNKLYEKINIALAFAGVILTLVLGFLDFTHLFTDVCSYKIWELILLIVYTACEIACVIFLLYATIRLLLLLKGKTIPVFKSEDVRDEDVYSATEEEASMWLVDKYTICTDGVRPIIAKKQKAFEGAIRAVIIGLILFAAVIAIGKVGVI